MGIRYIPTTNHSTRKKRSLSRAITISPPANCWLTAIVESNTISTTASKSSTTRVPKTTFVKGIPFRPRSSKALIMMVVDDIESIPPRKMRSIWLQPIAPPTIIPVTNIPTKMVPAVMRALLPTLSSFLKLNSRPSANSRKIMPISDHCSTVSGLVRLGKRPKCGPTRNPATMYPSINGCFRALNIRVIIPAEMNMRARSLTRLRFSSIICYVKMGSSLIPGGSKSAFQMTVLQKEYCDYR